MREVMVRYKLKKDCVEEHEALIRAVFVELAEKAPEGLRYAAFKQPDGVSYVHVAIVEAKTNPLVSLASFKAFTAKVGERCEEQPDTVEMTRIGGYGI